MRFFAELRRRNVHRVATAYVIVGLRVTGRTSSFSFRGCDKTLSQIGSTLGVSAILEGSVRKQGDRVRIPARVMLAEDGTTLCNESYKAENDNYDLCESQWYAPSGETDPALAYLERAARHGRGLLEARIRYDYLNTLLRGHPGFEQIMETNLRRINEERAALGIDALVL